MIGLRQTIERGMRHRWLGPLFVVLFCLLLALLFLHAMHDAHHMGTEAGEFCLGLTIMFGLLVVIRLRWQVTVTAVLPRSGRAPPTRRLFLLPVRSAVFTASVPLRL